MTDRKGSRERFKVFWGRSCSWKILVADLTTCQPLVGNSNFNFVRLGEDRTHYILMKSVRLYSLTITLHLCPHKYFYIENEKKQAFLYAWHKWLKKEKKSFRSTVNISIKWRINLLLGRSDRYNKLIFDLTPC